MIGRARRGEAATGTHDPTISTGASPSRWASIRDLRTPVVFGYALLFLMVFAPTAYTSVKIALLAVSLVCLGLHDIRTDHLGVHPAVLKRTLLFVAAGLFFTLIGSLNGNPGAMSLAPLFIAWPIVYTALIGGLDSDQRLARVIQLLVVTTLAIEVSIYVFLLHVEEILPSALYVDLGVGLKANAGLYAARGRITEFDAYSIASLLFLVPFLIGALLLWPSRSRMPVRRGWLWVAAGLSVPLVLLSGRRGLWIAVGVAPVAAIVFRSWLRRGTGPRFIPWRRWLALGAPFAVATAIALWAIAGLTPNKVFDWLQRGFDLTGGRSRQLDALVDGWKESPLIGKGLGAVATKVIRSNEQPWAYELVYVALLFAIGVVGIAIFSYGIAWIIRQSRAMIRDRSPDVEVLLSLLVGTAGILVASVTNPYITKFDALWTIFLPIAFINHWLLARGRTAAGVTPSSARGSHRG